jgi:8-oxo-dGTP diphosphatase
MAVAKTIEKIGLAVLSYKSLLLVRKRESPWFILPGGKPEAGESDLDALIREVFEELSCGIDLSSVTYMAEFSNSAAGMIDTRVTVRLYLGVLCGAPRPSSEIVELLWYTPDRLSSIPMAPSIEQQIVPFLANRGMVNSGALAKASR